MSYKLDGEFKKFIKLYFYTFCVKMDEAKLLNFNILIVENLCVKFLVIHTYFINMYVVTIQVSQVIKNILYTYIYYIYHTYIFYIHVAFSKTPHVHIFHYRKYVLAEIWHRIIVRIILLYFNKVRIILHIFLFYISFTKMFTNSRNDFIDLFVPFTFLLSACLL